MSEDYHPIEIDTGMRMVCAIAFFPDGEHLAVSTDENRVLVWRMQGAKPVATLETMIEGVQLVCVAISPDGRWVAAGTYAAGTVVVWDAVTREQVWRYRLCPLSINGVDFSPDSSRLVAAASEGAIATVFDVASHKPLQILGHENHVVAAKYSSQGDRIATADQSGFVRVWDSNDGSLLLNIPENVTPFHNTGLLWLDNHLFVVTERKIKELDTSRGLTVWEWSVHATNGYSCIALPKHGRCIAFATKSTITFWDTLTHTQLSRIPCPHDMRSLAISQDDQFIAIGGNRSNQTTIVRIPSYTTDSIPLSRLHPTLQGPDILIDDAALNSWQRGELQDTETLLTTTIDTRRDPIHHALACRSLIRVHLRKWRMAIADAEASIDIQPSVIGYIAKSMAYVIQGEKHKAYRFCDIASELFHASHITFLLLIRAIIVFMAEEHVYAISRMDDLIATVKHNSIFYVVQAYMHLLVGNLHMESSAYDDALQSFERAQAQLRPHTSQTLFMVALISGWKFDDLDITIRQRMCEVLYLAGRTKDAGGSLLDLVHTFEILYLRENLVTWVSDFAQRCLSTQESDAAVPQPSPTPLLREWAKATVKSRSWRDALVGAVAFIVPRFAIYRTICEYLEMTDCITEAIECFQEMMTELGEANMNKPMTEWVRDFTQQRLSAPANTGDGVLDTTRDTEMMTLNDIPSPLLKEWAKAVLTLGPWEDAIHSATTFAVSRVAIYRVICERLETTDRITDAVKCFHRMASEFGEEIELYREDREWASAFRQRYSRKSECREEQLGNVAMDEHRYEEAITLHTIALSLDAFSTQRILLKRSKAYLSIGSWKEALADANQVIALDPSSPWGYETKHVALHKAGDYDNAVNALEAMLTKMEQSSDPEVQRHGDRYISPSSTRATIRKLVHKTTRHLPRELINTIDGRLYNRADHVSAFESLPIFNELVSSTTTRIDYVQIKRKIRQHFQYVMLSHKWEENEPLFQQVASISVYDLGPSPTHEKLQAFCKIARDAGFVWAWSDTCCINKSDHFILQEALVAMFKWYEGSILTIVYLRGVHSLSHLGALMKSIWNTRAWTLQEYIAAKVVLFYTEDWKPYLNLQLLNHKESPEVISEMEEATGMSAKELITLRPGLSSIREKLRLASTRKTTYPEDAAYSLLGIFSATGIPAIYGEGEGALGRLLANILTRSGDVGVLAWNGESGSFNSCLPAHIGVFSGPTSSHLPRHIPDTEMGLISSAFRISPSNIDAALRLCDRVHELPTPRFAESRLTLPCIAVRLPRLTSYRTNSGHVYRADTDAFGMVEIKTKLDLSRLGTLYLVHPWLGTLLEHEDMNSIAFEADTVMPPQSPNMQHEDTSDEEVDDENTYEVINDDEFDDLSFLPEPGSPLLLTSVQTVPMDRETRAIRFVARLRQPFGALLFRLKMVDGRVVGYKRVAAESAINVQFREDFPLADILDRVRTFDVL